MPDQFDDTLFDVSARGITGGMNTKEHPTAIRDDEAVLVQNFEFRKAALGEKRDGSSIVAATIDASALTCWGLGGLDDPLGADRLICAVGSTFYDWDGAANTWGLLTVGAPSGDARVTFVQSRRFSGTVDHVIHTIQPNATVYRYNGSPTLVATDVPRGTGGFHWLERLWVTGNPTMPDLVFASSFGEVSTFDLNLSFKVGDGDRMMKAFPYLNHGILCLMNHAIYLIDVDQTDLFQGTFDDTQILLVNDELGCVAEDSVMQAGRDVLFLSRYGVHSLIKTEQDRPKLLIDPISAPIEGTIDRINFAAVDSASATIWDNKYILGVPLDSATQNSHTLVYDLEEKAWAIIDGWKPFAWHISDIEDKGDRLYYIAQNTGIVYFAFDSAATGQDAGTDIDARIETKRHDFGDPRRFKYFQFIEVACEQLEGGFIKVEVQFDGDGYTTLGFMHLTGNIPKLPLDLPFELASTSTIREKFYMDGFGAHKNAQFRLTADRDDKVVILFYSLHAYLDTESFD